MKRRIFTLLLVLTGLLLYAQEQGPHGGVLKQTGSNYIEMKVSGDKLYAFLLDQDKKPVINTDLICIAVLYFRNNVSTEHTLDAFEKDGFSTTCPSGFYSCKITFFAGNKKIWSVFDSETKLADTQ